MRVSLVQGAYTARSIIADAQRSVNLYSEKNPPDSLAPYTQYNTPGTAALTGALGVPGRGLYWANTGALYYAAGTAFYYVSPQWALSQIGTLLTDSSIVSMADNGTTLLAVDGSANGYAVDLTANTFSLVSEANNGPPAPQVYAFYGADRVDILDGFMLLNQPGTRNFYSTYDNEVIFDSLYFAAKNGYSDNLKSIVVSRREIWLPGERTSEIWFNAGAPDFPFQIMPGPFVQHGLYAVHSLAQVNGAVFWLSQDQAGKNVIVRAEGYQVKGVSTKALENEMANYSVTNDAEGFCFQLNGHAFYQINFPTADKSWRWDEATELWHEPVWTDSNGIDHRHRSRCAAFAYDTNVVADWETGQLYKLDPNVVTDNGAPMYFRRGFPHMMADGVRVQYPGFVLDVEAGTSAATTTDAGPEVLLRWSDDRGRTWSNPVSQSFGSTGQYLSQPQWNRLGMARDRVFEVYGVIPGKLAINGAFLDPPPIKLAS